MISYEALIAFVVFLAIFALFAGALQNAASGAENSRNYATAKINAEKCAALVNGLYENSGGGLDGVEVSCFVKGERIASRFEGEEAGTFLLYGNASNIESLSGTKILVRANAHYK